MMNKDILKRAVDTFGEEAQLEVMQEECAELIAAISRYKRGRGDTYDLLEEIADVSVMLEQAKIIFGEVRIQNCVELKLMRLGIALDKIDKIDKIGKK